MELKEVHKIEAKACAIGRRDACERIEKLAQKLLANRIKVRAPSVGKGDATTPRVQHLRRQHMAAKMGG